MHDEQMQQLNERMQQLSEKIRDQAITLAARWQICVDGVDQMDAAGINRNRKEYRDMMRQRDQHYNRFFGFCMGASMASGKVRTWDIEFWATIKASDEIKRRGEMNQ